MSTPKEASRQDKEKLPNVIVGMGPGGLVTALELAKKGEKVLLLENREHFTRVQRVEIGIKTIEYIKNTVAKHPTDKGKALLEKLKHENIVEISEIQEFLKEQLSFYEKNITVKQGKHIVIESIQAGEHQLKYKEGSEEHSVVFKHLIAADGARRETSKLVAKTNKTIPIEFRTLERQTRQAAHGTINVSLKANVALKEKQRELSMSDLPELQKLGWDEPYLPKLYIWPDDTGNFYVAGEIPAEYLKLEGEALQKSLERWAQVILEKTYGYTQAQIGLKLHEGLEPKEKERDKLKTTAFQLKLEHAVKAGFDCDAVLESHPSSPGAHTFLQIGDASRNTNLFFGHGVNDAINDGILVAECLNTDGTFNLELFNQKHEERVSWLVNEMNQIDLTDVYEDLQRQFKAELEKLAGKIRFHINYIKGEEMDEITQETRNIEDLVKELVKDSVQPQHYEEIIIELTKKVDHVFNKVHEKLLENITLPDPRQRIEDQEKLISLRNQQTEILKPTGMYEKFLSFLSGFGLTIKALEKINLAKKNRAQPLTEQIIKMETKLQESNPKEPVLTEQQVKEKVVEHSGILHQFRSHAEAIVKLDRLKKGKATQPAKDINPAIKPPKLP